MRFAVSACVLLATVSISGSGAAVPARAQVPVIQEATDAATAVRLASGSDQVLAEISRARLRGFESVAGSSAVFIRSACGFAGCSFTYLVSIPLSQRGPNRLGTAIIAIVRLQRGWPPGVAVMTQADADWLSDYTGKSR